MKNAAKSQKTTLRAWADEYCRARGFTLEQAERANAKLFTEAQARAAGYAPAGDGLLFQNVDVSTGALRAGSRLRLREPQRTKDGRVIKFVQRRGTVADIYRACSLDWLKLQRDTRAPIIVSEGEPRALAGAAHNLTILALGGVDSGFAPGTQRGALVPELRDIKWKRRDVFIAFDADAAANAAVRAAEDALAELLTTAGARVRLVRLPNITADGKSGLDDLLAGDGGRATFLRLCDAAPVWNAGRADGGATLVPTMLRGDQIEDRPIDYLWDHRVPLGMLTGLCGNPSDGKTWIALNVAAEGSRGREPYSQRRCAAFSTVYWSVESLPETLRRRFRAMGGDLRRLFVLAGATGEEGRHVGLTLSDVPVIESAMKTARARLLVIDPLQSFLGAKVDMHRANETRPLLDGLSSLARRLNIAVIVVRHLSKNPGARTVTRALGSVDITGAMRTEYMVGTAPDDARNRALVHTKPGEIPRAESLRFDIEGKDAAARLVWHGVSQLTAADIAAPEGARRKTKVEQAAEFLWDALEGGQRATADLQKESGFDQKTLQRAALQLRLEQTGRKDVPGARMWARPELKFARQKG
jgi:hypothetical protein